MTEEIIKDSGCEADSSVCEEQFEPEIVDENQEILKEIRFRYQLCYLIMIGILEMLGLINT